MVMQITEAKDGVPLQGAVVNIALAGAANAAALWTLSAAAGRVGTTSVKIKRLRVRANAIGANVWFQLGTGVGGAFANLIPPVRLIDNIDNDFRFEEPIESNATVTGFPTPLPAGSVDAQVLVDEIS